MRLTTVTILGAACAAAAVVLLCRAGPTHSARRVSDARIVVSVPSEVSVVERRTRLKNQLARRVVAERIPLTAAADLFDAANGEDGTHVARVVPGRSARERVCRQVILYVITAEEEIRHEGGSLPEPCVSAELQAELDRRLAAGELPPDSQ